MCGEVLEARWHRSLKLKGFGHEPPVAKEHIRAPYSSRHRCACSGATYSTWPSIPGFHQACLHGVCQYVQRLVEDVLLGFQAHGTVAFGAPEGLESAEFSVEALSHEPVEMGHELW